MAELFKLYRLQQLDTQIDQARQRISEILRILNDHSEKQSADSAVHAADLRLEELGKSQKSIEALVNAQKIKIQQNQAALYGGKVKNPKELQGLESEAAALQRHLTTLEDQLLDSMLGVEQAETVHQAATLNRDQIYATSHRRSIELHSEKQGLEHQIHRLSIEKATIAETIPPDELVYYEELRLKRNGIAVSRISDSFCTVCGTRLNSTLIHTARTTQSIARCETCGRILFAG